MRLRRVHALVLASVLLAGCSRPAPRFSTENARAHLDMLAGTIGCRLVGTPENDRARAYIIDQLRLFGYDVRVQSIDARRPELGLTAHVNNIIATRAGRDSQALGLVSHYDSVPESPGGGDDGIGVAVSLEAARVLAADQDRRHTLIVLMTDGEEAGLMGAAGLATDRDVMSRLQAYVNVEATGSGGTGLLFETGPGNGWMVKPWARTAPHPRGVSYAVEIYRRLPNDTDFSIFKRQNVPGLNFAVIEDSYAYHTARDTADRVPDRTLRTTGENTVATLMALDAMDLGARSKAGATFFDIGQTSAVAWGPTAAWIIAIATLALGTLAWVRVLFVSAHLVGWGRWALDLVWTLVGVGLVALALVGGTWALRESRAVYHPWYAHPSRLFAFLLAAGALAGWCAARIGMWIPRRAHGPRHPMLVWSFALPAWIVAAGIGASATPAAGYLWTLPLLAAGAGLLFAPLNAPAVRAVSVAVLGVAGTLWIQDAIDLLNFSVALLGRLPIVTPVYVFAALMLACGLMVVPPFVAATAATKPVIRPSFVTALLLVATVITGAVAYRSAAYTHAQPQRRAARVLIDPEQAGAIYEIASLEPGIDLLPGAPAGWTRVTDAPRSGLPVARLSAPFVFRTTGASPGRAPAAITSFTLQPVAAGSEIAVTVTPSQPGLAVAFLAPAGLRPARSNLPGVVSNGRWHATFVAPPAEGVTWRAAFGPGHDAELASSIRAVVVSHRYPGGEGWQSLPAWLPQETAVWRMELDWLVAPAIAPVPPLR